MDEQFLPMGFEDLEKRLKKFFHQQSMPADVSLYTRIREEAIAEFRRQKAPWYQSILAVFSGTHRIKISIGVLSGLVLVFNLLPFNPLSWAGEVTNARGLVEILRNNKIEVISQNTRLLIGDIVRVGNNAEVEIHLPKNFVATATSKTELRVLDQDSLFLSRGHLSNQATEKSENAEVSTTRGLVRSDPGAAFDVYVSESGEVHIVVEKMGVSILDPLDHETSLHAGEELRLRTDTRLADKFDVPNDISLSTTQLLAIESKLLIARTKILGAVEKKVSGQKSGFQEDVTSAERTFRSIVNVLNASRNLEIEKRKNTDLLTNHDVYVAVAEKVKDPALVEDVQSIETLIKIVTEKENYLAFSVPQTASLSYNRFVLLERIFQLGTPKEQLFGKSLKDRYVHNFLQDITQEPLKIDQASVLNKKIGYLPKTLSAANFLREVQGNLDLDLAKLLEEKIAAM
jgi:hypothetical protein